MSWIKAKFILKKKLFIQYISFILNRNKTKEERLAEVKEFVQTIVSGPETQEGDNAEALALNNAAGILIDLTDFLRAGAADNEENPVGFMAAIWKQLNLGKIEKRKIRIRHIIFLQFLFMSHALAFHGFQVSDKIHFTRKIR